MSDQEIKAIETEYAGVLFRSRLEARYAMFFDRIGLSWEYEPDWFQFDKNVCWTGGKPTRYAPDFMLSGLHSAPHKFYLEVKREGLGNDEGYEAMCKAMALAELTKEIVVLAFGYPGGIMEAYKAGGFNGLPIYIADTVFLVVDVHDRLALARSGYKCPWERGKLVDDAVSEVRRHRFWDPKSWGEKNA